MNGTACPMLSREETKRLSDEMKVSEILINTKVGVYRRYFTAEEALKRGDIVNGKLSGQAIKKFIEKELPEIEKREKEERKLRLKQKNLKRYRNKKLFARMIPERARRDAFTNSFVSSFLDEFFEEADSIFDTIIDNRNKLAKKYNETIEGGKEEDVLKLKAQIDKLDNLYDLLYRDENKRYRTYWKYRNGDSQKYFAELKGKIYKNLSTKFAMLRMARG